MVILLKIGAVVLVFSSVHAAYMWQFKERSLERAKGAAVAYFGYATLSHYFVVMVALYQGLSSLFSDDWLHGALMLAYPAHFTLYLYGTIFGGKDGVR